MIHWATGGDFTSFPLPGSRPNGLLFASDGNFYGTTADFANGSGYGTFYRLSPDGVVTLLHRFDLPSEGISNPSALAEGPDGNFYGIISGTDQVFRITPAGDPTVVFKALQAADVGFIDVFSSSLTRFSDGNFYGAARDGVYTITPSGSFTKLIRFADVGLPFDPGTPIYQDRAALLLGGDGKFYGATPTQTQSSLYQISSTGAYQLIYRFPYAVPGTSMLYPEGTTPSRLTQGPDGLYGTTNSGGGAGLGGTIFKITFSGGGTPILPP